MTSILFEGTPSAYLPEISAYREYLKFHFPNIKTFDSREGRSEDAEIIWRFMGIDYRFLSDKKFVVHEYNSLSTGRSARLKNIIKRTFNVKPDRRVFLNKVVEKEFSFPDNVPFRLRDMGIDQQFFQERSEEKEYDFIYVGGLDRGKIIESFLDYFAHNMEDSTILLIGSAPDVLQTRYKKYSNIIFKGQVPYALVPSYVAKARYGLNLMPDRYPFNLQTSTKLLEYCASGLKIVSSRYRWIEQFSQSRNGNFFWIENGFKELNRKNLENYPFYTPDLHDLMWERVIENSGIFDFLKTG